MNRTIIPKIYITLSLLLPGMAGLAQTGNNNYIRIRQPRLKLNTSTALDYNTPNKDSVTVTFQYIDGLGRPLQTVQQKGSQAGYDIIQPFVYDRSGRDSVKLMPYTVNSALPGSYQPNAIADNTGNYLNSAQYVFYQQPGKNYVNTTTPYAGVNYEPSELNRVVEQGAPGTAWQLTGVSGGGHTLKMDYASNDQSAFATTPLTGNPGSRMVALYTAAINSDQSRTLVRAGNNATYPSGQLTLTISKDENWNPATDGCLSTTEEYKDLEGHVVLKRTYNQKSTALEMLSTYYVYDDYGNLAFVLPPQASPDATTAISQGKLNNYCYQYRYDDRGRLTQKRLPGKGWEYVVYNSIDQPVATQDSLQRAAKQWIFTKYDGAARPIMTGVWNNGGTAITRDSLQRRLNGFTNLWETPVTTGNGYTDNAWPTTNTTPLTINYYDNYSGIPSLPTGYTGPTGYSKQTRGLLTASLTAVLNNPADMLWSVHYYDDLGRSLKTYAQHYLGGTVNAANYDAFTTTYNFTNAPLTITRLHYNIANTAIPLLTITNTYTYDHVGRKIRTWEQIQNTNLTADTKTLVSKLAYNEMGQVATNYLHSTDGVNFLQNVAYTYNERGWLLGSSALLFQMQLQYNNVNGISTITPTAQYNGNIASQSWGTSLIPDSLSYTYTCDRLNRLLSGNATNNYKENSIAYDQGGNITALKRYQANTLIDNFTYTYSGTNQLKKLRDTLSSDLSIKQGTWTYTYDGNGNLITDPTKGISGITYAYNLLNLPQSIAALNTTYIYDANGQKLRRIIGTNATDYIGGIQYDNGTITFIQTDEGRALPNGTTAYNYEYALGDNLGNTRLTFDTGSGVARQVQQDDYYPFGMDISRSPIGSPKNEYLYNRKEFQENLGVYDYGARFYDPVIGRWNVVDPLAEKSRRFSTYAYVNDNPIRFIDPDGMEAKILKIKGGKSATDKFKVDVNKGTGGLYRASLSKKDGTLKLVSTGKKGQMTDEQKNFTNTLKASIGNPNTTTINLVESDATVKVDNIKTAQLDMDDVNKYGDTGSLLTKQGVIAHVVAEQTDLQANGGKANGILGEERAHRIGIGAENRTNGSSRGQEVSDEGGVSIPVTNVVTGVLKWVDITIKNGNVTKVDQ